MIIPVWSSPLSNFEIHRHIYGTGIHLYLSFDLFLALYGSPDQICHKPWLYLCSTDTYLGCFPPCPSLIPCAVPLLALTVYR